MKGKNWAVLWPAIFLPVVVIWCVFCLRINAATIFDSSYVSLSPDGRAWTTCAGDKSGHHYGEGTTVATGISSSLRTPEEGEHYYGHERTGTIPVGRWVVEWSNAQCIHNSYPEGHSYHGVPFGREKCMGYYHSGWIPYCADCNTPVAWMFVYMTKEAAATIDYLDTGIGYSYYYCCPLCTNLEQAVSLGSHLCKQISPNQYRVDYNANSDENYGGYMHSSYHVYNNEDTYEGKAVTPVTKLTKNTYHRVGFEFCGWNTKADGSGAFYADEAEILNLSVYDCFQDGKAGIVTLYAQWRKSESTLEIDPAGGSYLGNTGITRVTQFYGTTYEPERESIFPPSGATLSFETYGGDPIEAMTGAMHFAGWRQEEPFGGLLEDGVYYFRVSGGSVDRITALYESEPVTLPGAYRENYSFGGWYYDSAFQMPAGGEGDRITLSEDTLLYAQWVELRLCSKDNYEANGGKGAVDLSWEQQDNNGKVFKLYQRRDSENWQQIYSAEDVGEDSLVSEVFTFSGEETIYIVPSTGLYTLTACGAQGENYGEYNGGLGGTVTASFWLTKGEELHFFVGGQNGCNGGGAGDPFGNGGGYTLITSNLKGDLVYAGGGGAATGKGNGGEGGTAQSLTEGHEGESGHAGGGGGYRGGRAGELITHHHTEACYHDLSGSLLDTYQLIQKSQTANFYNSSDGGTDAGARRTLTLGSADELIPVSNNATLELTAQYYYYYSNQRTSINDTSGSYLRVYDQNGKVLLSKNAVNGYSSITSDGNEFYGTIHYTFKETLSFPAGTTGIYIVFSARTTCFWSDPYVSMPRAYLRGMRQLVCGREEGEVESYRPAYGGSSWVNEEECVFYTMEAGTNSGDGNLLIEGNNIGYLEDMSLCDVSAPDLDAPESVPVPVRLEPVRGSDGAGVTVSWTAPRDHGTSYYHMVESCMPVSGTKLCSSNITENILITGVRGYYYILDYEADTPVTVSAGSFLGNPDLTVKLTARQQYLHLAAVDGAGNISDTTHISIDALEIPWPLYTRPLQIEPGEQVYYALPENRYYVRADGRTPFTLEYKAYMEGKASASYQQNYVILETKTDGERGKNSIYLPNGDLTQESCTVEIEKLQFETEGKFPLGRYPYMTLSRKNYGKELEAEQKFLLNRELSGNRVEIMPVAGAIKEGNMITSDLLLDKQNSITIVADGEAPDIQGMESLLGMKVIDRNAGTVKVRVVAEDTLSGIREFYVKVTNEDNHLEQIFEPDENGNVTIEVTAEELLFTGDFIITAYAVDNVGNAAEVSHNITEFSLDTAIERILTPHEPVFKRGESGILHILTQGYADRVEVEFPEELLSANPELNTIYDYADFPEYQKQEQIQFMIPMNTETDRIYTITIKAYKGDRKLEEFPDLAVLEIRGSILDDLRTRLR